jgi:hypothetical protein
MIGTIRKYSKWLTIPLFTLVIIAFVFFMSAGPARNNGSGGSAHYDTNVIGGSIYGQTVTPERYAQMEHDVNLYYLFNYGEWPHEPDVTKQSMMRQVYIRMMLAQKAQDAGVHISDAQVAQAAAARLRSPALLRALGIRTESVPFDGFVGQVLNPAGMTQDDFENFVRDDLAIEQLQMIYGLPGLLITPMEATNEYVREFQEMSAEVVFFSASNYLSRVSVPPSQVGQFYTNFMADYRLPERRQVDYVDFSVTNYLKSAEQELLKSNLDQQVDYDFKKFGMQATPDAKTPEDAKAEIRRVLIRQQALIQAGSHANDFAQAVFNATSPTAQTLATMAHQKGLQVQTTQPFSAEYGPQEFVAPPALTRTAFELSSDSPIAEPIAGPNGVYVIALVGQYPEGIPPLSDIRDRVTHDLMLREATFLAQRDGTNFARNLTAEMVSGHSFAAASVAAGAQPQVLPPFSLSTQDMPELGGHATIGQLKEAVFTTPIGFASGFEPTADGGFVSYVESKMPVDQAKMAEEMPQFMDQLREQRESQAFNEWVQREGSRVLQNTPLLRQETAGR